MSNDPGYREALEEIEAIVEEIESESVDIDVLTDRVRRATFLIKLCKAKLKKTDDEVKKVLKEFEAEEEG